MPIFSAIVLIILVVIFHKAVLALLGPFLFLWILITSIYGNYKLYQKWRKYLKEKDDARTYE